MDELLTPVRTTYLRARNHDEPLLVEVPPTATTAGGSKLSKLESADDALFVLRSQPSYTALAGVLRFLTDEHASSTFNLHIPSPKSAAIVHVLVTEIAPNYWTLLKEGSVADGVNPCPSWSLDAQRLIQSLQSVAGVNAVVGHAKALVQESKSSKQHLKRPDLNLHLAIFLDLLAALLHGTDSIRRLWQSSACSLVDAASKKVQSQSLISLITSGKILSFSAEATEVIGREDAPDNARWLVDGVEYSKWIGRNIANWAKSQSGNDVELQVCFDFYQRSLSLGYAETLVIIMADELLLSQGTQRGLFSEVCLRQSQTSKKVIYILLEYLSRKFLNNLKLEGTTPNESVSAVAGVVGDVVRSDQGLTTQLVSWCCSPSGAGLGDAVGIRRAVVAVLAKSKETIISVLEKSLNQFGDQLYIKHTAIMQQEVHTQVLLLSAGYVARLSPVKLTMILRSGAYLSAISNRIASTHARARFFGMYVGEGLSALQDKNAKKLDFHMEEMDTEEAQWFKGLTKTSDNVGPAEPLLSQPVPTQPTTPNILQETTPKPKLKPRAKPRMPLSQPVPKAIIEEIDSSDDDDEEDDKFAAMDKGSDDEDSEDDATLVRRNKPKPPVYIRDLITFLRDSESYDKQELGVQTAPVLIRRKANYGTEVSAHAEELARLLVGLQNKFDIENFEDLRLQGMIALVVAQPKSMAPWFARTFFEGDYSLSQRTSVLVTLGLSAREIAGMEASEYKSKAEFPSKRLPEKIEQLYIEATSADGRQRTSQQQQQQLKTLPPNSLDKITQTLTSSFLGPLAAEAADANSGPDALKLQTFTARYKSKSKIKPRTRAIPNTTAAALSACFFSPLTAHFQFALRSSKPVVLNPAMLALYLQTLGIIVNAAGPSTLSLPQLTSELWDLLLRVRVHVLGDVGAMKGWLVALSVLLEVNEDNMRRLCEEQGRELVESREWVSGVFERTRGEDGGDENDVKMLAAGVLIKLGELIQNYQALLMGSLIGFN
ncbi:telomere binding protein [Conoideocrella luteorostrata]|uniref:Telomere binding protein n=1 Tax=Conoideocrella luteorostrata TaxID=1105319 RepID=A0AAJ0CTB1_9HYPO|nr:telomere binding protein [Conoideocrella luteorostrata]